ncbi:MAG: extracellular solute-binding protein [Chloroflexi bacterium]|nr:MAG: extracellular solute-binding protein [Chloroflexota bacterium]
MRRRLILSVITLLIVVGIVIPAAAQEGEVKQVTIMHYFSGELGNKAIAEIITNFTAEHKDFVILSNPIGHEDFKTTILIMLAGDEPPDFFSYWAGARVQFVVDAGRLAPIDDMWESAALDDIIPASLVSGATMYNGQHYLIPFNYHFAGFFYNPQVFADAGITALPTTWDEFLAACETLKAAGVAPIALGSMNRWPAQFWFDYLLLRTAGPEYRARLMAGEAAYTDPEVVRAMEMWKELVDKEYFYPDANAYDWTDAANQVANGEAGMTLMGTWITGYWDGMDQVAGENYDVFPFPTIDEGVPMAAVGPVDGWVLTAGAKHPDNAKELMTYLISDLDAQAIWAKGQGALAANANVDQAIYSSVMIKALDNVKAADTFAFNYDLATTPPMAEGGLDLFAKFMDDPSGFQGYLEETEAIAVEVFEK